MFNDASKIYSAFVIMTQAVVWLPFVKPFRFSVTFSCSLAVIDVLSMGRRIVTGDTSVIEENISFHLKYDGRPLSPW